MLDTKRLIELDDNLLFDIDYEKTRLPTKKYVMNIDTRKQELMTWKTGEAYVFQPDVQLHNGFNRNPGERTTLLIDFYKESLYTKEKFEKYYQNYSECFEGLDNLVDVYETRKKQK